MSTTTFTRTRRDYDHATDTAQVSVTEIVGNAIQVRGDPRRYKALGLVLTTMPTLFWTPATYGECPSPGDTVLWQSKKYTVRDVDQIAPDGVVIAARIVVGA